MTIAAILENITPVTAFIDEQLEALDCSMKAQMQIDVAIDELFGNIARYAYGEKRGDATVRFDFDEATRTAIIAFIDGGVPFNPLEKADPDVTLSADERGIGGLGIFMVKKTMDLSFSSHAHAAFREDQCGWGSLSVFTGGIPQGLCRARQSAEHCAWPAGSWR